MDPRLPSFFQNSIQYLWTIDWRIGICHHYNRCKASMGGRFCARANILLLRKTWIPKMSMNIHEAGGYHIAFFARIIYS